MTDAPKDMKQGLGLVQVYTGNGKGKTTASLGLGFRAAGRGLNVLMIQFLKPAEDYGEHIAAGRFDNFTIMPMGLDHMCHTVPREEDVRLASETLAQAEKLIFSGRYDLVILDEVNVAMSRRYLEPCKVIDMLKRRPGNIEIVLTGRGAPPEIIEYADLVTEMLMIKHPFDRGVKARKGIEY